MTNRWTLRAAAVVLGLSTLAFSAGLAGFIRISHARRTSLHQWNTQRCAVYRRAHHGAADPCGDGPMTPVVPALKASRVDLADARTALDRGDEATAAHALARALDRASDVERRSTIVATAIAAKEVSDVLDVVDAFPAVARRPELRAALARTSLATAARPLEAERLHSANLALTTRTQRTAFVTWGATDARIADAVEREDALLVSMQHAARAGDLAACQRAGEKSEVGAYVCPALVRSVATARRLDRARR